jgi:hypothetical protein
MRDGRFNTSKCRGKLQKMGVLCTHPPKQPRPLQHARALKKYKKISSKKLFKKTLRPVYAGGGPRPAGDHWSPPAAGRGRRPGDC